MEEKNPTNFRYKGRDLLTRQKSTFYENQKHDLWDDLLPLLANPNKNPSKILLEPWKNPTKRILNMSKSAFFTIYHTFLNLFFIIWPLLNHVKHGEINRAYIARRCKGCRELLGGTCNEQTLQSGNCLARRCEQRGETTKSWWMKQWWNSRKSWNWDFRLWDFRLWDVIGIWDLNVRKQWDGAWALIWDWNGIEI